MKRTGRLFSIKFSGTYDQASKKFQDWNHQDIRAMLGMLIHTSELLLKHTPLDSQTLENFKQNGIRALLNHYSLKSRSKINEI